MRIRALRLAKQITQAELAEMVGVTQGYISHLEAGTKKNPCVQVLMRMARVFSVTVDELF